MSSQARPLTADDLDWVADLSDVRRQQRFAHAPRFWRPAADAKVRHRAFLARLLEDPSTLALRTESGFVLGVGDDRRRVVDDFEPGADQAEGVALLQGVLAWTATVRVVVPDHDAERRAAVEAVGLRPAETWWHRDLPLVQVRGDGGNVQLRTDGATGRLVPAPPVYDPGGSVLLVTEALTAAGLAAIEADAAERGATVSVVSQKPDDLTLELIAVEAGHVRTTTFYA